MTDRPILFSAPMVRALLSGSKTQTRRIIKPQPFIDKMNNLCAPDRKGTIWNYGQNAAGVPHLEKYALSAMKIKTGDRLWVRENWQGLGFGDFQPTKQQPCEIRYAATDPCADLDAEARGYPWRPSIHMPRSASRITLTVTKVRAERLQDISEADAIAEGIEPHRAGWMPYSTAFFEADGVTPANYHPDPRESYRQLWNKINGFGAWDANPWVVAYTFTVHPHNIDELERDQ
jgi:hypothetical protein